MSTTHWLKGIDERIIYFLSTLSKDDIPGRYFPCLHPTKWGSELELGFSCLALKCYAILNQWDKLDERTRDAWIGHINSYQSRELDLGKYGALHSAYVDYELVGCLSSPWASIKSARRSIQNKVRRGIWKQRHLVVDSDIKRAVLAETKQALATLSGVHREAPKVFTTFPHLTKDVYGYLDSLDWSHPWSAGGQAASLPVFFDTQGHRFLTDSVVQELVDTTRLFFDSLVDKDSGGYFRERKPSHSLLVNGAMKVLTGLDWLKKPIHYPENLIKSVLLEKPRPDGCHLVDAVYVLYRCSGQTKYMEKYVKEYLWLVLDMVKAHHNFDGGFSYNIGASQTNYYGVPISNGKEESDIHGTLLLTWALSMIFEILDEPHRWKPMRP